MKIGSGNPAGRDQKTTLGPPPRSTGLSQQEILEHQSLLDLIGPITEGRILIKSPAKALGKTGHSADIAQ
jgi:hypothetical protein